MSADDITMDISTSDTVSFFSSISLHRTSDDTLRTKGIHMDVSLCVRISNRRKVIEFTAIQIQALSNFSRGDIMSLVYCTEMCRNLINNMLNVVVGVIRIVIRRDYNSYLRQRIREVLFMVCQQATKVFSKNYRDFTFSIRTRNCSNDITKRISVTIKSSPKYVKINKSYSFT